MGSWHEIFELDPSLVATEAGIEKLETRTRDEVMVLQSDEYKEFRSAWNEIRQLIISMIPEENKDSKRVNINFQRY